MKPKYYCLKIVALVLGYICDVTFTKWSYLYQIYHSPYLLVSITSEIKSNQISHSHREFLTYIHEYQVAVCVSCPTYLARQT